MVRAVAATTDAAAGRPSTVIMLTATMIVATAGRTVDRTEAESVVDPTADRMAVANMVDLTVDRMAVANTVDLMVVDILPADTLVANIGKQ